MTHSETSGFTLIEIVLVMGILGLLIAITLIAINPARQFAQANNAKRQNDVRAILNAVQQYTIDNRGILPTAITTTTQTIAKSAGADICSALVTRYLSALPVDPLTNGGSPITNCSSNYSTNYSIVTSATNNRLTISAPASELGITISINQ